MKFVHHIFRESTAVKGHQIYTEPNCDVIADRILGCPTIKKCPTKFVPLSHKKCPTESVPLSHKKCSTVPQKVSHCLTKCVPRKCSTVPQNSGRKNFGLKIRVKVRAVLKWGKTVHCETIAITN